MNQLDLHSGEDRSVLRLGGLSLGTVSADEFDGGPAAASTIHRLRQFCRLVGSPLRLEAEFALRHDVAQSIDDPHAASVQEEGRAVFCVTDIWPGADVADIWFASDRNLRFRFRSSSWREDAAITFRCYQYDPRVARLVSVGEQPVGRAEVEFFDAALLNPFLPVLIGVTAKDGSLLGTSLLPFPSLCRGGLHYAELISEGCDVDQLSNVQAISLALLHSLLEGGAERAPLALGRIEVDLRGATGAEPIFSIDVREWLETVMDIGCSPARAADIENPEVRTFLVERLAAPAIATSWRSKSWTHSGRGGHALSISFDALPSLHALVAAGNSLSPRKGVTIGGFAVAKSGTASPSWVAFLPPMGESILALQPRHSVVGIPFVRCLEEACDAATAPTWPLAIRFVDFNLAESKAALLMPVAPDVSGPLLCQEPPEGTSITVLIPTSGVGDDGFVTLVESLRLQTVSDRLDIVVILEASGREARTEIEGALSRHFDGRYQIISCSDGDLRA